MSPFLAIADSGTDSIRGQFVEHLLMLSTWACGRVGEPFPDHHLSLDPVPPGNLCSTQDPEIDARSLEDACNHFFFSRPYLIAQCTAYIRLHISDPNQFLFCNLFCRLQIYKQPNCQLKQPNFRLQPRQQLGPKKTRHLLRLPRPRLKLLSQLRPNLNQLRPFHASIAAAEDSIRLVNPFWNNLRTRL